MTAFASESSWIVTPSKIWPDSSARPRPICDEPMFGHDDDGVTEIHRAPLRIGQAPVIQYLQQPVVLFDEIENADPDVFNAHVAAGARARHARDS